MTRDEALNRLMRDCSQTEKSASWVKKKLTSWGMEHYSEEIIKKLRSENFIDDARYVKAFIHDKIVFNKWGKIKIRFLLSSERVPDAIIKEHLSEVDEEEYRKMIFDELEKKKSSLKKLPVNKIKMKLLSFGSQRGYEIDLIYRFLNEEQ
jgi:regulatory protein